MKTSWKNFLSRRGVTLLEFMRQTSTKDYESLTTKLKMLGVRPPSKSEALVELDAIAAENVKIEKPVADDTAKKSSSEPDPEPPKAEKKLAPKRKARRKKTASE